MNFFISDALAQDAAAAPAGGLMSLLPMVLIVVIFYFMLIRPQMKRAKEHKQLIAALAKGDEVVTNGGLLGKIAEVGESFVRLEVAENAVVKVQRHAVSTVMPKGTIKSA